MAAGGLWVHVRWRERIGMMRSWAVTAGVLVLPCSAFSGGGVPAAPQPEIPAVSTNRYISFVPGNSGSDAAIRVLLMSLSDPGLGAKRDFSAFDGQVRWVGPPQESFDHAAVDGTFTAAGLQCDPYFRDWGDIDVLHVFGSEVVPASHYDVQMIFEGADTADELDYSAALSATTSCWADVVMSVAACSVTNGVDLAAVADAFLRVGTRPVPRTDLDGDIPDGLVTMLDLSDATRSFAGELFPSAGPDACPRARPRCGNGLVERGEECDDGDEVSGDGCDAGCVAESRTAIAGLVPIAPYGTGAAAYPAGTVIQGDTVAIPSGPARVWLEARIRDWDPQSDNHPLQVWQLQVDGRGYSSAAQGELAPAVEACGSYSECAAAFGPGSACPGLGGDPGYCSSAFIDQDRSDGFPDAGFVGLHVVDAGRPDVRFGRTLYPGEVDDGSVRYGGTLVLDVSEDASGVFTVGLNRASDATFLQRGEPVTVGEWTRRAPIPLLAYDAARVVIGDGCCLAAACGGALPADCAAGGGTPVGACLGDCDGNGRDDACDITDGTGSDCNGDWVLDVCDPDCNGTGTSDLCDIAGGASDDCNGDGIPDECQPDEDCNVNGMRDICDIGGGTSLDCNLNLTPDECELAGRSADGNGNGIPDAGEEAPGPDPLGHPNTRTLSIAPSAQRAVTALRVRLMKMYNTDDADPDTAACGPRVAPLPDLSAFDGEIRWAGPPQTYPDEAIPPAADFVGAQLQCCPHFRDWSPAALSAEFPAAATDLIHLFGPAVVPCSEYEVQAVSVNCTDLANENCYSDVLTVRTPRYGEVWRPFAPAAPGQPNLSDINAVVLKYKGVAYHLDDDSGAPPKYRAMVRGNVLPLTEKVNFVDIGNVVNGYKSIHYPEPGPVTCAPCP